MQFRPLGEQAQHSSYPDLVSFHRQNGSGSRQDSLRRSASLQDVSCLDNIDSVLMSKKLTPILRGSDTTKNNANEQQQQQQQQQEQELQEKGNVKFGNKEIHLLKDQPLPPIEGSKGSESVREGGEGMKNGESWTLPLGRSPQPPRRLSECPRDIFPRGQPVEVKKPVTPKYDDYPEAYWELRSPTLQDPRDLKEDMIDRDHYRLRQISALHLRAMNRDVTATRTELYNKWQHQMHERLPSLGHTPKPDSSRAAPGSLATFRSPPNTERYRRQQKMSLPVRNQPLAILAKPSPSPNNPALKKAMENSKAADSTTARDSEATDRPQEDGAENTQQDGAVNEQHVPAETEKVRAQKQEEAKKVTASVVNLSMVPDRKPTIASSEINTGVARRNQLACRPQSDKVRTRHVNHHPGDHSSSQENSAVPRAPRGLSAASNDSKASSSLSQYMARPPGASPPPNTEAMVTNREAAIKEIDTARKDPPGNKMILTKFNRLQVFGETQHSPATLKNAPHSLVMITKLTGKKPYMPQNRPPTYRLDMRNYPPCRAGSADQGAGAGEETGINMENGGYPILVSERGGMPIVSSSADKVDASALSFRFRDGEVIVSRQGKKPNLTWDWVPGIDKGYMR